MYMLTEEGSLNYELVLNSVPSHQLPKVCFVTDAILVGPHENGRLVIFYALKRVCLL